jgi:hypothetical protein
MEAIAYTLQWLVGVLATFSLSLSIWDKIRSYRAAKLKLRAAEESSFVAALASDDLDKLGQYLDEKIGAFDISEYVSNTMVADRVDRYIGRILSFVGTDEDVSEDEKVEPPTHEPDDTYSSIVVVDDAVDTVEPVEQPFHSFLVEAEVGESWNALARLRRHVEIELRAIAANLGFKERHLHSAGQIIQILSKKTGVNMDALGRLRYAVSVCNRAIHGREVSDAEAAEAVSNALVGLKELRDSLSSTVVVQKGR